MSCLKNSQGTLYMYEPQVSIKYFYSFPTLNILILSLFLLTFLIVIKKTSSQKYSLRILNVKLEAISFPQKDLIPLAGRESVVDPFSLKIGMGIQRSQTFGDTATRQSPFGCP